MDTKSNKSIFQFNDPEIIESIFLINENYKETVDIDDVNFNINVKITKHEDESPAEVTLTVANFDFPNIEEVESTPYYLYVTMRALFFWDDSLKNEELNNFLQINAPSLIFSYLRPYISQLTSNSKYGPLNIPFINFTNQVDD